MMKKILLFALEALMVLTWCGAEAQENACSDTIYWGSRLSFLESECCWTVPEGSNWGLIAYSDGIAISNPDSADHWIYSPWIEIPATAAADSVMLCFNPSAPCNADYSLCVTIDGTTWDTLYRGFAHNSPQKIYMGDYAGQMVRLGFCHYGYVNSNWQGSDSTCSGSLDQQLRVCCITLRSIMPPVVTLAATDEAFVGTPKNFKVIFTEGTRQGLSCMWHSTLMDSTITLNADFLTLNYTRSGVDTLTVAVTNNYGSDTAQAVVTVYDCSPVSTLPWKARMKDFKCWRSVGDRGFDIVNDSELKTQYDGRNCTLGIATQGITLPNDTAMLTLHWKAKRENGEVYPQAMYLLVSTEESDSLASYDTIFFTTSSSYNDYTGYTADLSSYGGRTVYMAFLVKRNYGLAMVHIKDIEVIYERMPMVTLSAPLTARVGGSIVFSASLEQGDTLDANMACHSSLLDSTWVSGYSEDFTLVYPAAGVDTVTVTVSNPYGSSTSSRVVHIFQCDTIAAFPWVEEFVSMGNEASYNTCWEINGWRHLANNHFFGHRNDLMESNTTGNYMVMPPIRVPETGAERLKVWVIYAKKMLVTVSTDGGQTYPDTVYFDNDAVFNWWLRTVPLAPYAGQTVHVRLASTVSSSFIDRVVVDYETSPCVALIVPERIATDVPTLCVATLRYGDTAGLVYTWHSQVGGTFTTNATGDSAWVTYSTGITGFYDTISVIATNSFGADTVCHPLQVIDCAPATTLPWTETFADGIYCWYKPYGSKFIDAIPDNYYILEYLRHLYLNVQNDTLGSWIMSKAVEIPADTTLGVTLFWKVASSDNNYHHLYSVLVTTSNDYTDTANYTVLYTDSSTHINFSNYDTRSVSLAQYAGQTIHVAIHNHGNHLAPSGIGLYFDNVEIRASQMPVVRVTADATTYYYGDTARFTATLLEGIANGITYTWHSALMDTTFTGGNTWSLGYGLANGRDTVIVIATNVYGSDTASVIVNSTIITQPVVSFGHNGVFLTDTTVFTAHILNHCVDDSMTYTWHSSLMDTTFTSHISTFTLLYTLGGTDTVTLIVDNHYATDTATMVLNLIDCRPKPLPWNEDFEGVIATAANVVGDLPVCWDYSWNGTNVAYAPHVITPTGYQYITDLPSNALFLVVGGYTGYDNTATVTLPHFADSLQHLSIAFDYRFETAALGTLTVGYCDSNGLFTAVKTLPGHAGSYLRDTISLYAATLSDAQIALRWEYGSLWYAVAIDNIAVFNADSLPMAPLVAIDGPTTAVPYDTVIFTAQLLRGDTTDLTYTWHSTLLGRVMAGPSIRLLYETIGVDTLSVIATTAIGVNAAMLIVTIDTLSVPDTLWRTITLLCDSTMGTVSGAGTYPDSSTVAISAIPFEGYHFVAWNDNDTRTVRTITLVSDTAFTAYFAADTLPTPPPDTLWRTVAVTANVDGVCETYGSGTYADSSRVEMGYTMVDTVNEGGRWQFLGWSDGENDNPRTILVTSDTVIVALFEWMADSVGINELRDNSYEIRVYPNPAHGAVTVSVGAPATLTVLDLTGRVVIAPLSLSSSATLPLTDLPSGTYFLRVTNEEGTAVKRLIVK